MIRILHSGSKAQDREDSRNHVLQDPYLYIPSFIYSTPRTAWHVRILMFMWSLGPLSFAGP